MNKNNSAVKAVLFPASKPEPGSKTAFTLIELLVVVLIIGILAAIALPQYQKAVDKSRFMEVITNTAALKSAMERYCLQVGDYLPRPLNTAGGSPLDIDLDKKCKPTVGDDTFYCPDSWYDINADHVVGYTGNRPGQAGAPAANMNAYRLYFDQTANRGVRQCIANDGSQRAINVCTGVGGVLQSGTIYRMP